MNQFKYPNSADLALGYNIALAQPLDSRSVVKTYNEMVNLDTWTKPFNSKGQANKAYTGMIVAVVDDTAAKNGVYEFIGLANKDEGDPTKWVKLSSASSIDAFKSITYDADNEQLVLVYLDNASKEQTINVPMKGLIEEYVFQPSTDGSTINDKNLIDKAGDFNTAFKLTRNVKGQSIIMSDVNTVDCGWY